MPDRPCASNGGVPNLVSLAATLAARGHPAGSLGEVPVAGVAQGAVLSGLVQVVGVHVDQRYPRQVVHAGIVPRLQPGAGGGGLAGAWPVKRGQASSLGPGCWQDGPWPVPAAGIRPSCGACRACHLLVVWRLPPESKRGLLPGPQPYVASGRRLNPSWPVHNTHAPVATRVGVPVVRGTPTAQTTQRLARGWHHQPACLPPAPHASIRFACCREAT